MQLDVLVLTGEDNLSERFYTLMLARRVAEDIPMQVDTPVDAATSEQWLGLYASVPELSRLSTLTIDSDATGADLKRLKLETVAHYGSTYRTLIALAPERLLRDDERLSAQGIHDGDLIILLVLFPHRFDHQLQTVAHPRELLAMLQSPDGFPPTHESRIWGAVLYTDEDAAVAAYIRAYYGELHNLSGEQLRIFVVERPSKGSDDRAYWRDKIGLRALNLFALLGWLSWRPYDRSQIYDVARTLGVDARHLPCVVLFDSTERAEKLVFPITEPLPGFFRALFSELHAVLGDSRHHASHPSKLTELDHRYRRPRTLEPVTLDDIAASYAKIRAALRRAPSDTRGGNQFSFHGTTVFVNRPYGDVAIEQPEPAGGTFDTGAADDG